MANSYDDYQKQLASIYEQIQNRGPFQYDMNADPLYQQYKDQYVQGGKLAMKDTMGQAAGLTGGYGSTYGQQVGQQAYNAYLQNLGAQIPKLYEMAYGMYRDRGDDLLKQYNFLKANPVEAPLPEVLPAGGGDGPRDDGDGKGSKLGLGAVAGATLGLAGALGGIKGLSANNNLGLSENPTRGEVIRAAQKMLSPEEYRQFLKEAYDYKPPKKQTKKAGSGGGNVFKPNLMAIK